MTTLEDLLRKAAAIQKASKRLQETDEARRERSMAAAARMMARYEWKPVASVALIEEQICRNCGSIHQMFRGFGVLMHRQSDNVERLLMAKGLDQGLPATRRLMPATSEACIECLPEWKI